MCTTCVPGDWEGQKKTSDSLKVELQVLVSYHVGSGSRTQASGRAASTQLPLQKSPKHLTNYVTAFFYLIFLKPGTDYYEAQGGLDHEIL